MTMEELHELGRQATEDAERIDALFEATKPAHVAHSFVIEQADG